MKYLATLLVVLLIPTAALAKGECKEDKQKFCVGLSKNELWGCLNKHEAELSGPCKAKLADKAKEDGAKEKEPTAPAEQPQ
jgi:hypothetical protein